MIRVTLHFFLRHALAILFVVVSSQRVSAQRASDFVETGGVARNFTLKDRRTGFPVSLNDYAGKIVFLDLFAFW